MLTEDNASVYEMQKYTVNIYFSLPVHVHIRASAAFPIIYLNSSYADLFCLQSHRA